MLDKNLLKYLLWHLVFKHVLNPTWVYDAFSPDIPPISKLRWFLKVLKNLCIWKSSLVGQEPIAKSFMASAHQIFKIILNPATLIILLKFNNILHYSNDCFPINFDIIFIFICIMMSQRDFIWRHMDNKLLQRLKKLMA